MTREEMIFHTHGPTQATRLDQCAWLAMAGMLSNPLFKNTDSAVVDLAETSYRIADEMLSLKHRLKSEAPR